MRAHSAALADALSGSFERRLYADVMHGTDRVLQDLPVESWTLRGDLDASPRMTGSGTVVYSSEDGESLVPVGTDGILSPFRASLLLVMEISAGNFSERIALGTFRIDAVPSAVDTFAEVNGRPTVVGSRVEVDFTSLELGIIRRGFRFPESPKALSSCYEELRRITGFPVYETLPDRSVPTGTVWEARRGGRWDAVEVLADLIGGVAVVDSAGSLRVVPYTPSGAPVASFELGDYGTVIDVGYDVDTQDVCNVVVGQFEDADRKPITSVAVATSGDLAPRGLYGEYTDYYSNDRVKTKADADAAVAARLAVVSGGQFYDVPIQMHVNPLPELGDLCSLDKWVRPLSGQLVKFQMSDGALMNGTLRVRRSL